MLGHVRSPGGTVALRTLIITLIEGVYTDQLLFDPRERMLDGFRQVRSPRGNGLIEACEGYIRVQICHWGMYEHESICR